MSRGLNRTDGRGRSRHGYAWNGAWTACSAISSIHIMSNDSIKWQWEVVEQLLKWRNRCFEMAERAPTEVMGAKLLSMGHRYEIGARLIDRARECILGSEELIIGAE